VIVTLVGLMGTGKSSVAVALAARWPGFSALDLDAAIEARAGTTIAEVFARDGEPAFRALEQATLGELLELPGHHVLATGGGAPCQPGAMDRLLAAGPVVWLDAPPALLVARALTASRPLLAGRGPAEAELVLAGLLAARRDTYGRAHVHVDATRPLDEVVLDIDQRVAPLLRSEPAT